MRLTLDCAKKGAIDAAQAAVVYKRETFLAKLFEHVAKNSVDMSWSRPLPFLDMSRGGLGWPATLTSILSGYSMLPGMNSLHLLCTLCFREAAKLFLEKGLIDIKVRSSAGYTPMHYAAPGGDVGIIELLLSQWGKRRDTESQCEHSATHH